jgi:co-chaperonin GroES (HSP10)
MQHDVDPKDDLLKKLGNIKDIEIFHNQLLCAVYIRPEKTKSGIVLPGQHRDEDRFQGKVGLVIKQGPDAFVDANDHWFKDLNVNVNDWVVFRPSDGWSVTINNVLCRILDDVNVRGRVKHPDQVW